MKVWALSYSEVRMFDRLNSEAGGFIQCIFSYLVSFSQYIATVYEGCGYTRVKEDIFHVTLFNFSLTNILICH